MCSKSIFKKQAGLLLWVVLGVNVASGMTPEEIQNEEIETYQLELIQTAFDVASLIPVDPNLKDRARTQELVVKASLELDQPVLALQYSEQILNWRRGLGYADTAYYLAEKGQTNGVGTLLETARSAAGGAQQKWRADKVRARIAQVWLLLENDEKSAEFAHNLELSESVGLEALKAQNSNDDEYQMFCETFDKQISVGSLDSIKNGVLGYAGLYERFYFDLKKRNEIESTVFSNWKRTPLIDRFHIYILFSNIALANDDVSHAIHMLGEAEAILEGHDWPLEYSLPLMADIASQWVLCGRKDQALKTLDRAIALYNDGGTSIVDIYRANALVPIAEAFAVADEHRKALAVYSLALSAADLNPNSRPTAEDLTLICSSMARHSVKPDQGFLEQVATVKSGLGDPW